MMSFEKRKLQKLSFIYIPNFRRCHLALKLIRFVLYVSKSCALRPLALTKLILLVNMCNAHEGSLVFCLVYIILENIFLPLRKQTHTPLSLCSSFDSKQDFRPSAPPITATTSPELPSPLSATIDSLLPFNQPKPFQILM
ncbi:hypothetical protein Hanom_Chr09g00862301 [Helianthus anomalus]